MSTHKNEKLLRAIYAPSRDEAQQKFDAYLRGDLPPEEAEWMRAHLLQDEASLLAFAERVAEKVDTNELPLRPWPREVPLPPRDLFFPTSPYAKAAPEGPVVLWSRLRAAAERSEAWARKKCEEIGGWLRQSAFVWGVPAVEGPTMGPEPTESERTVASATVLDAALQPTDEDAVSLEMREAADRPTIHPDGTFTCTVSLPEERWVGTWVLCRLTLVEGTVSFEGRTEAAPAGQGGKAHFSAAGLPQEAAGSIPLDFVEFFLVLSGIEEPS